MCWLVRAWKRLSGHELKEAEVKAFTAAREFNRQLDRIEQQRSLEALDEIHDMMRGRDARHNSAS